MKKVLAFIFLLFSISFVLADTIQDTSIHVRAYNNTLEFTNPDYSVNNRNVSLNITNNNINLQEFDFPILFIRNESVDISTVKQLTDCLVAKGTCDTEKSQFNMGWSICKSDLDTCNLNNNQSIKDQLTQCNTDKTIMQTNLDDKIKKVDELEKEVASNGNSKFLWAAGGGGIVFIFMMFIFGKWGNQNKDKSPEEMNPARGY